MALMSGFSKDHQVGVKSLPSILAALDQAVTVARYTDNLRFEGEKVTKSVVLNALMNEFASWSGEQQIAFLRKQIPILEALTGHTSNGGPPAQEKPRSLPKGESVAIIDTTRETKRNSLRRKHGK